MLKKGDFVEIDYIGKIKASGQIFDFTVKEVADEMKMAGDYGPVVIVIGAKHVIPGLEEELQKHKPGDEFHLDIAPEKAFGPRNSKLVQLVPMRKFRKDKVDPYPGLRVSVDGKLGTVRSTSGGRVIVDFNHPLAGRELHYWLRVNKKLTKKSDKITGLLKFHGLQGFKTSATKAGLSIKMKTPIPEVLKKMVSKDLATYINIRKVNFVIQKVDKLKSRRASR
jgi:FKBP-type peptidyl-prolyl cis-trans isomerase SlyD